MIKDGRKIIYALIDVEKASNRMTNDNKYDKKI